jgi:hypothetical protein
VAGFLALVALIVIYFVLTILARNKRIRLSVFALNLLLGENFSGWQTRATQHGLAPSARRSGG